MDMELILFNESLANAEPLEIGKTNGIRFNLMDGSRFRLNPMNVHSQRIILEGWKIHSPPVIQGTNLRFVPTPTTPYEQLFRMITVMVHQMGGSVTIQPDELMSVDDSRLNIYQQADPFYYVLKIKED